MTGAQAAVYGLELKNLFNVHYNNLNSTSSPGINDYELSLYLTQAHRERIYNLYDGTVKGSSFDVDEKTKVLLSYYTKAASLSLGQLLNVGDPPTDTFSYKDAVLPDEVWWLLKENLVFNPGFNNKIKQTLVKPISHDTFWMLVDNPFKSPDKFLSRAWRLDISNSTNHRTVRLVYTQDAPLVSYNFTYLTRPEIIVISDLSDSGTNLSIEGTIISSVDDINIPDALIYDMQLRDYIINRAVELATRDYKQNTLDSQLILNSRYD